MLAFLLLKSILILILSIGICSFANYSISKDHPCTWLPAPEIIMQVLVRHDITKEDSTYMFTQCTLGWVIQVIIDMLSKD